MERNVTARLQESRWRSRSVCLSYDRPGNVRELENAIERAGIGPHGLDTAGRSAGTILETETRTTPSSTKYHEAVAVTKKRIILQAMDQAKGNFTDAAKLFGR